MLHEIRDLQQQTISTAVTTVVTVSQSIQPIAYCYCFRPVVFRFFFSFFGWHTTLKSYTHTHKSYIILHTHKCYTKNFYRSYCNYHIETSDISTTLQMSWQQVTQGVQCSWNFKNILTKTDSISLFKINERLTSSRSISYVIVRRWKKKLWHLCKNNRVVYVNSSKWTGSAFIIKCILKFKI